MHMPVPYTGTLEGVDDPHVPVSLLKLWVHELVDLVVPSEMCSNCIALANDCSSMGVC